MRIIRRLLALVTIVALVTAFMLPVALAAGCGLSNCTNHTTQTTTESKIEILANGCREEYIRTVTKGICRIGSVVTREVSSYGAWKKFGVLHCPV